MIVHVQYIFYLIEIEVLLIQIIIDNFNRPNIAVLNLKFATIKNTAVPNLNFAINSFINSIFEKICSLKLHGDNFRGECGFTFEAMKRSAPSSERRALIGFFTRQDLLKLLELPPFPCHHMCSAVRQARWNVWG